MTTRDEFEKWVLKHEYLSNDFRVHHGLSMLPKRDDGTYISPDAAIAWDVWQTCQQEIDALKAEIERLKSNVDPDFISDLIRSKNKYPENKNMLEGLYGEISELIRAYKGDGNVRDEAFDVAVVAYRIATEGDSSISNGEMEGLEPKDHIRDANKMILPPNQSEHKLNMVPASNQDALGVEEIKNLALCRHILSDLANAINNAHISSWQSTADWRDQLDVALQYLETTSGREE